jgi:amidase
MTVDFFGAPTFWKMNLVQTGNSLSGDLEGDNVTGSLAGDRIHLLARDNQGGSEDVTAKIIGGEMRGEVLFVDGAEPSHAQHHLTFSAVSIVSPPKVAPQLHEFVPTTFYRQFSPANPSALHINPGDTIHTITVDAMGVDERGVRRTAGGNPQTGPFYINGAMPGDTLVVHIRKLKLNRDYAISTNGIVGRANSNELAVKMNGAGERVKWHLDLQRSLATPADPSPNLSSYSVPVKPMLGCIAVAVSPRGAAPGTTDSGDFGGNLDYNELGDGATIYLPVLNPGALLYFGDAHAVQGDGETTGDALETSMDVEVSVDLIRGGGLGHVRFETPSHLVTVGLEGSLDTAIKAATADMASWLAKSYNLTPTEFAQILGTGAEYRINEVADRNAGVVLKISKLLLSNLPHVK